MDYNTRSLSRRPHSYFVAILEYYLLGQLPWDKIYLLYGSHQIRCHNNTLRLCKYCSLKRCMVVNLHSHIYHFCRYHLTQNNPSQTYTRCIVRQDGISLKVICKILVWSHPLVRIYPKFWCIHIDRPNKKEIGYRSYKLIRGCLHIGIHLEHRCRWCYRIRYYTHLQSEKVNLCFKQTVQSVAH